MNDDLLKKAGEGNYFDELVTLTDQLRLEV